MLYLFGGSQSADAKFFDSQGPVIVGVEGNARMIVGMHAQHFLRHQFERQQQFRAICQQEIHVFALEFDDEIGILEIGNRIVARLELKLQLETRVGNHLPQKLLDPWTRFVNRIPCAQVRFLMSFDDDEVTFFGDAITVTGEAVLLKNHCWVI